MATARHRANGSERKARDNRSNQVFFPERFTEDTALSSAASTRSLSRRFLSEHIEAIYDGALLLQATFLHGAVIDEIVGAYYYGPKGRRTFYTYTHDRRTSVTALADHTGQVVQTYAYSPFGADRTDTGAGLTPNVLKYTGREQDASGLYYYRARYYDPSVRRFLTEDPLGFDAGMNFYAYASDNPLSTTDPLGLYALQIGFAGSYNIPWIGASVSLGGGIAIDDSLHVGLYHYVGPGILAGAEVEGGSSVQVSDAKTISDLKSWFYNASGHLGDGIGGSLDYFNGMSPNGIVTGAGLTLGLATGAAITLGETNTRLYAPLGDGSTPTGDGSTPANVPMGDVPGMGAAAEIPSASSPWTKPS